jgi:hypothetical protein
VQTAGDLDLLVYQYIRHRKGRSVFAARMQLLQLTGFWDHIVASTSRRTAGLLLRGVWHIDKVIYGKRICESTGTRDLTKAEALLGG